MKFNISYIREEDKCSAQRLLSTRKCLDKTLSAQKFSNALVLPFRQDSQLGGVVSEDGIFVNSTSVYEERKVGYYEYCESKVIMDNTRVVYLGLLLSIYGHAITDNIKRVWWFRDKKKGIDYDKVVYIANWDGCSPAHVKRVFELANISIEDFEQILEPTRFREVIVPDNSFIHHEGLKYYTSHFLETIQTIKNKVLSDKQWPLKIYFTRTKVQDGWRRDTGETSLEKVFKKQGFTILSPESHSVDDQIAMMVHCKEFVSTEGSIAHNTIWCKPGTKAVLLRKANVINVWQAAINEIADLDVTYIDAHKSIRTNRQFPMIGPFYMCITPHLERYVGQPIFRIPVCLRPSWFRYKYQIDSTLFYRKSRSIISKIQKLI